MKTVTKFLVTLAFAGLIMSSATAQNTYIITANGTNYDVNGGAIIADCSLWNAIDAIKTAANSANCTIQFGATGATDPLELHIEGAANTLIRFNNSHLKWGTITLTGKAVANFENYGIMIDLGSDVSINCKAELTINGKEGAEGVTAIYNSGGTVTITDGTILATGKYGKAVDNRSGTVNISGGTISVTGEDGRTVDNYTTGTLTISGGTISVSGDLGTAVDNYIGAVNISGGTILATGNNGKAIRNSTGTVTLTGGILFAYGTADSDVTNIDNLQTGNAVIVAWNKAAGTTTYITGTTTDIYKNPESTTAIWTKETGNNGISVKNNDNKGFIPIKGITITDVGIVETHSHASLQVYPNPTTGQLIINDEPLNLIQGTMNNVGIYDVHGIAHPLLFSPSFGGGRGRSELGRLDVSNLPAGVYFLRIGDKTIKFVKE